MTPLIRFGLVPVAACLAVLAACGSTPAGKGDDEFLVAGDVLENVEEDRVICKRQRVAGSHIPKTVCKTESQIEAERAALDKQIGLLRTINGDTRGLDINTLPQD